MRNFSSHHRGPVDDGPEQSPNWRILRSLWPYLTEFPGRVLLSVALLVAAKLATVAMPLALKHIVDSLEQSRGSDLVLWLPLMLVLAYGALRLGSTLFGELRDAVFARVAERAMRRVSLRVFEHLHRLELGFHLSRRTGALARDIERGTTGISFLLRFMLFNIVPTLLEIVLVAAILFAAFRPGYVGAILFAVVAYVMFSVKVTEWRTRYVRESNEMDNQSNTRAVDSLLNFETVKYFGNEAFESKRYDKDLGQWEAARMKNRLSLAALNSGQALIIAITMTVMMWMAVSDVQHGAMTLGDLTMINAYLIQVFIPLNALGFIYREIRQSLVNIERMFTLLGQQAQVVDKDDAIELPTGPASIRFDNVRFGYQPERRILDGISFEVPAGHKVAVVGRSGAGKSTIGRLLFRFFDVSEGAVLVNGIDIRDLSQSSLRAAIGVVPQDTVLFNDTIWNNIAYGRPDASAEEVRRAAQLAHLDEFIAALPEGYDSKVGERGLKVSGGEKQRIAIARVLLKNPPILLLDEATSSLDSHAEQAIIDALNEVAARRTTLVIAHRLSTIRDADEILVLDQGKIVERGHHDQLLADNGVYASLWRQQQRESSTSPA